MTDEPRHIPLLAVAGMSRAGTTFLYHNLQQHPRIFVPTRKEVCYFGHNHDRGFDWFRAFYDGIGPDQIGLDVCGLYFVEPRSIERLLEYDPGQRVILGLRDPRQWAFSIYEQYSGAFDVPPLMQLFSGCTFEREGHEIEFGMAPGQIRETVKRFAAAFGNRLLIFDFRLLSQDPLRLLRAIEAFAGVEPWFEEGRFTASKINARGRRHSSTFDRLLQVKGVADTIARLVPRRLLLAARRWIDARSSRGANAGQAPDRPRYTEGELAFVEERFAADSAWMEELFAERPLRTGDTL